MDIIKEIVMVVLIISIPSVLTFQLYKYLKKKSKYLEYVGFRLFVVTTIISILTAFFSLLPSGFGPDYETLEIKQNIGGKLVCNSVSSADIHTYEHSIDYKYINTENDTIDFHGGSYCGREWKRNEQIQKYDSWLILKTGFGRGSDRLIIKNIVTNTTKIHNIDAKFIEADSLWRVQNFISRLERGSSETFIENINGNEIFLKYKLITSRMSSNKQVDKMITYKIDNETGNLKMIKIK